MKIPAPISALIFLFLFGSLLPEKVVGYDSPNFDTKVFSADGIFLSENDKQTLLEALAALASNFPSSQKVDSDLKEKSLGVALLIDPLHYNSRQSHKALKFGKVPAPTNYFESLSSVSEALWVAATNLSSEPIEPEQMKLAPLLMEISLLAHPSPSEERLRRFAQLAKGKGNQWGRFLQLQPDDNQSTMRANMFSKEISNFFGVPLADEPMPTKPLKPSKVPFLPEPRPRPSSSDDSKSADPIRVSIPTVRLVKAVSESPVAGEFGFEIRRPQNSNEKEFFPFIESGADPPYPRLPLFTGREGVLVEGIEFTSAQADARGWNWPKGMIGEIRFDSEELLPGPRRICRTYGRLPASILMECALLEKPLNPSWGIAGELGELGRTSELQGDPLKTLQATTSLQKPYVLMPESALAPLVQSLQTSGELKLLFETELIAYSTLEEALTSITTETDPALLQASKAFAEIESVSSKMPLDEFARNEKVQERLQALIQEYPRHLSAKAILEFGRKPVLKESMLDSDIAEIDKWIGPYFALRDFDTDLNLLRNRLEETELEVSRLRSKVGAEARDYHTKASDLIEAAEKYLSLTNRTTAIGEQRLREVLQVLDELDRERALLGVSPRE